MKRGASSSYAKARLVVAPAASTSGQALDPQSTSWPARSRYCNRKWPITGRIGPVWKAAGMIFLSGNINHVSLKRLSCFHVRLKVTLGTLLHLLTYHVVSGVLPSQPPPTSTARQYGKSSFLLGPLVLFTVRCRCWWYVG